MRNRPKAPLLGGKRMLANETPKPGSEYFPKETYASGNPMVASCGHEDSLGHLTGTVCGKCARKGHKKAMGR